MPLTPEQHEIRMKGLFATDVVRLCNLPDYPWGNCMDVALEKLGMIEPEMGPVAAHKENGHLLEPYLCVWCLEVMGLPFQSVQMDCPSEFSKDDPLFGCTLDCDCGFTSIDAKAVGVRSVQTVIYDDMEAPIIITRPLTQAEADAWGDEGTDQVPDHIYIQLQVQAFVKRYDEVHVAALVGDRGLKHYPIPRNDDVIEHLRRIGHEFQDNYIAKGRLPEDFTPRIDLLKRRKRVAKKAVVISPGLPEAYDLACQREKAAKDQKTAARTETLAALGDAEIGLYGEDQAVTYFANVNGVRSIDLTTIKSLERKGIDTDGYREQLDEYRDSEGGQGSGDDQGDLDAPAGDRASEAFAGVVGADAADAGRADDHRDQQEQ